MAEIKWIKITTDMFEHEKLDFILSLPEADAIIIIWIRLLTLAGKVNAAGYVLLTENIPYTEDMLSHKFRKPSSVIKLALETLRRLKMIEFDGEAMRIANWDKYQNIEGMEKIREQTKKRVENYRSRQKTLESPPECNVTGNATSNGAVTRSNATDIDIEKDIQEEEGERPQSAMDAYLFSFKKFSYTGQIQGYVGELLKRGFTDAFIREVFLEMGARGANPDERYMRKLAEDWITNKIYTRVEAERRKKEYLKAVPTQKKRDSDLESRDREIAFNKFIAAGGNPDEFDSASNA